MQAADAVPAELRTPEPLRLLLRGTRDARLRGLDERTDDVRLPAVVQVAAEARVRLRAAVFGHPRRDHRLAVGRRQRELAHLQVAVHRERERSRDRRSGEVQDVRAPPFDEGCPLRHPEPVLLVDDGDREIGEVDLLLDEGVRPDDDLRIPRGDELPAAACSFARRELVRSVTRTPSGAHSSSTVRKCCSASVSVGAMSAPCRPALDRTEERVQRDDGLPGSDLALEETLHGDGAVEVGVELGRLRAPGPA